MDDSLEKKIRVNMTLGKELHRLKLNYLKNRDAEELANQRVKEQAEPIVAPIVEAIKNSKVPTKKTAHLSGDDVRDIFTRIKNIGFDRLKRNRYIQAVMNAYDDGDLFNTFLTLNKIGYFTPPIAKMSKYGVVNSIIFYGQGGKNLDSLSGGIQPKRYKKCLEEFDEIYEANAKTIREVAVDKIAKKPPIHPPPQRLRARL